MTADQKRAKVVSYVRQCIGRNIYSQNAVRRECVFKPYSNGRYYSDCSSFVRWLYRNADIGLNNIGGNTVGQYQNKSGIKVACAIKNGVPTDVNALRVGDILLFAGSDTSRAYADYVGHVEIIYSIKNGVVTLAGHGSGNPKTHKMTTYCRSRYAQKTNTKKGNKGLLKVVRFIPDDKVDVVPAPEPVEGYVRCTASVSANVRKGPGTQYAVMGIAKRGDKLPRRAGDADGWVAVTYNGRDGWISGKYAGGV